MSLRIKGGKTVLNFLEQEKVNAAIIFFKKQKNRKWICISSKGHRKNGIGYTLIQNKHIVQDVNVIVVVIPDEE